MKFPDFCTNKNFKLFVLSMLKKNPLSRIFKLYQVKQHAYFSGFSWDNLINLCFEPPYLPEVKSLDFKKSMKLTTYIENQKEELDFSEFKEQAIKKVDEWWNKF